MGYLGLSCLSLVVEAKEPSLVVDWLSSGDTELSVESSDSRVCHWGSGWRAEV